MSKTYEVERQKYKPQQIRWLLIAESPPPSAEIQSSRQFYYTDRIRKDDRLFVNTIRALYPEAIEFTEAEIEQTKVDWLNRFKGDGWFMIEALEVSQHHEVTKKQRQEKIADAVPRLIERLHEMHIGARTGIVLIKSNVFEAAAGPLREAGFTVLNRELVDYPGQYNQRAYREKLAGLVARARKS